MKTKDKRKMKRKSIVSPWKKDGAKHKQRYSRGMPLMPTCTHDGDKFECRNLDPEHVEEFFRRFTMSKNRSEQDAFVLRHLEPSPDVQEGYEFFVATRRKERLRVCRNAFLKVLRLRKTRLHGLLNMVREDLEAEAKGRDPSKASKKVRFADIHECRILDSSSVEMASVSSDDEIFNNVFNTTLKAMDDDWEFETARESSILKDLAVDKEVEELHPRLSECTKNYGKKTSTSPFTDEAVIRRSASIVENWLQDCVPNQKLETADTSLLNDLADDKEVEELHPRLSECTRNYGRKPSISPFTDEAVIRRSTSIVENWLQDYVPKQKLETADTRLLNDQPTGDNILIDRKLSLSEKEFVSDDERGHFPKPDDKKKIISLKNYVEFKDVFSKPTESKKSQIKSRIPKFGKENVKVPDALRKIDNRSFLPKLDRKKDKIADVLQNSTPKRVGLSFITNKMGSFSLSSAGKEPKREQSFWQRTEPDRGVTGFSFLDTSLAGLPDPFLDKENLPMELMTSQRTADWQERAGRVRSRLGKRSAQLQGRSQLTM